MIILHIGFPKTASTALQMLFSRNVEALAGQGLCYPLTDSDFKQRSLKSLLRKPGREFAAPNAAIKTQLDLLQRRIADHTGPAVLLSCEELTNAQDFDISPEGLSALASYLTASGRAVRIVAYIRNPVDYYLSRMQEKLKSSGGIVPPAAFLPLFSASVEAFEAALGTQAIVRPFHRADLLGGSIATDFFAAISDIVQIDQTDLVDEQVNESLSAEAMFVLDMLRRGPGDGRPITFTSAETAFLWRQLGRIDRSLGGPIQKPMLYRDAAEAARQAAAPDMERLRSQRGMVLRPHAALDHDCPLPPEARLASVEEIVQVDRSRAFEILRQLSKKMIGASLQMNEQRKAAQG